MGARTNIAWTERTWNPWRGCIKISPGCKNCYMFRDQKRFGFEPSQIVKCNPTTWSHPKRWNSIAEAAGRKDLVFTCSWSDFFLEEADEWRDAAWDVIRKTPNLIYQILTKRPERIAECLPADWPLENVWLGVSIEHNGYIPRALN